MRPDATGDSGTGPAQGSVRHTGAQKEEVMAMVRWNPLREIEDMQRRFDTLFGQTGGPLTLLGTERLAESDWTPAVDIAEGPEGYLINAELPDVRKEDVKLSIQDGVLMMTGERRAEKEEKNRRYYRVERSFGRFERSFTLPNAVDENKISASFSNGVLHVVVPKTQGGTVAGREIRIG
jgi:HSP20 family protein